MQPHDTFTVPGLALAKLGLVGHPWWMIDSVQSTLNMHSMLRLGGLGACSPRKILQLSPRKCHPEVYLA